MEIVLSLTGHMGSNPIISATSEQSSLCSVFSLQKNVRLLPCSSSSAKGHVRVGYLLASALITPPLHYQLFTVWRLTAQLLSLLLLFREKSRLFRLCVCKRTHNALHQFSFNGTITCVINLSFSLCWGGPSRKAKRHLSIICILFFSAYLMSFSTASGSFSYAP